MKLSKLEQESIILYNEEESTASIYTHDPNGYMVEITRALRPVTPQEDLDAGGGGDDPRPRASGRV